MCLSLRVGPTQALLFGAVFKALATLCCALCSAAAKVSKAGFCLRSSLLFQADLSSRFISGSAAFLSALHLSAPPQ